MESQLPIGTWGLATGAWHKGGNYGTDVNIPIPFAETNNPNGPDQTCLSRTP